MMSRSMSGSIPKKPSIASTSSRCCAVESTRHRAQGVDRNAWITGAILIASGRVPIVHRIVFDPSRLMPTILSDLIRARGLQAIGTTTPCQLASTTFAAHRRGIRSIAAASST